jgi:PAS domain S-box-containing protein
MGLRRLAEAIIRQSRDDLWRKRRNRYGVHSFVGIMMKGKKNCWEFKGCGREPDGRSAKELGVCPAANYRRLDGVHGGKNAGRACWIVAGTLGAGQVQGIFAEEYKDCLECDFYKSVKDEEGLDFQMTTGIEEMLLESENRYRMLFERAGDSIFVLDAEGEKAGQIVAANQAAAELHGYAVAELLAMSITDLDTPDAAKDAPGRIRRMLKGEWIKAEITHRKKDGTIFPVEVSAGVVEFGRHKYILAFDKDITQRKRAEEEREKLIHELQDALANIKTLRGLIPICAWCKRVREDSGYWKRVETYIQEHSDASFTHGICPECLKRERQK